MKNINTLQHIEIGTLNTLPFIAEITFAIVGVSAIKEGMVLYKAIKEKNSKQTKKSLLKLATTSACCMGLLLVPSIAEIATPVIIRSIE